MNCSQFLPDRVGPYLKRYSCLRFFLPSYFLTSSYFGVLTLSAPTLDGLGQGSLVTPAFIPIRGSQFFRGTLEQTRGENVNYIFSEPAF